ncbi:MAG: ABC transporter ATP-binding protein [Gemmobacter sp.]|nr:ABC transporter ATP-binding protein [Gemmobacter sp.]
MTEPILRLRDLVVEFPVAGGLGTLFAPAAQRSVRAVAGVTLDVMPGETLAIVGESGSGKTTLARALNGLVPISAGEVWFQGAALHATPDWKAVRRQMAMMFQDPVGSLSPRKSVRDLVLEPRVIQGLPLDDPDATAAHVLAQAGLGPQFLSRYPHELSGGQARRVGVARALSLRPALILADEPTAGLDVSIQGEILNLLNRVRQQDGLSTLIITHNLNILRQIADRVAVMYLGRIVEIGPVADILASPAHPYTAALLSANPELDPARRRARIRLRGETPGLRQRPRGCEFHPRCMWARPECAQSAPALTDKRAGLSAACHFPLTHDHGTHS